MRNRKNKRIAYFFCRFPWYPLTFVCHEIMALKRSGYEIVIIVLDRGEKRELHGEFEELWEDIRVVQRGRTAQLLDYYYFRFVYPGRVSRIRERFKPHAVDRGDFFKSPYLLPAFSVARHILKRGDIDYIHSHFSYRDSTITYLVSRLLDIPRGFTTHADSFVDQKYKLLKEQVEDCDLVFADTGQAAENILRISCDKNAEKKTVLKPAGINLEKFGFQEDIPCRKGIISICRFDPKKGLPYLIRAVHILIKRGHDIDCTIVGSANNPVGEEICNGVLDYIKDNKLEKFVRVTGFLTQDEYLAYMRKSAFFMAPYIVTERGERDGVPTGIIEAMAVGLVPVATDAGAITELVVHGENGLVVPQKDEAALADAVELLIGDRDLFERLRRNARKKIERERDVEKNEKIMVERLDELLLNQG